MTKVPYFAYGSNLDPDRITERLGYLPEGRPAYTDEFEMNFQKPAYGKKMGFANIRNIMVYADDSYRPFRARVFGVVYFVTSADLDILDGYEGGYHKERTYLHDLTNRVKRYQDAFVYIADNPDPLPRFPGVTYVRRIIKGSEHWGLPQVHRDWLRRWEERAWHPIQYNDPPE